jgi:hypothetical protein
LREKKKSDLILVGKFGRKIPFGKLWEKDIKMDL